MMQSQEQAKTTAGDPKNQAEGGTRNREGGKAFSLSLLTHHEYICRDHLWGMMSPLKITRVHMPENRPVMEEEEQLRYPNTLSSLPKVSTFLKKESSFIIKFRWANAGGYMIKVFSVSRKARLNKRTGRSSHGSSEMLPVSCTSLLQSRSAERAEASTENRLSPGNYIC